MKHLLNRTLLLLLALTWLVPKANASGYEYTVTAASDWGQTFTNTDLTGSAKYFSAAVSNNWMYTAPAVEVNSDMISKVYNNGTDYTSRIFRLLTAQEAFSLSANGTYFPYPGYQGGAVTSFYGRFYAGPAIANDTKGNLYFSSYSISNTNASDVWISWASPIGAITAFSVDARPTASALTTPTTIILDPTYNGTVTSSATNMRISYRSDVMSAYGDGLGGTGYLWFAPNNNDADYVKLERITLKSGVAMSKTVFAGPSDLTVQGTRTRAVQYAEDKIFYNGQSNGALYKGVINESSGTITWTNLGLTNQGTGATMFMLGGREILVYSSSTTSFQIVDVTDVNNEIVIGTYTPFTTASVSNQVKGHFINVTTTDDYNASIYIYVPAVGTEKYTITVTPIDPVQNLAVEVVKDQDPDQPGRQDAVLTWDAPASGTVSGYTVYRQTNPWWDTSPSTSDANVATGRVNDWSEWEAISVTTELTYTDIDVCRYSSYYERSYRYKVVPTFDTGAIGSDSNILEITPELIPFVPIWDTSMDQDDIKAGIDRYDGYCKVQLYWKFPQKNNDILGQTNFKAVYGVKPDYYSVYRNGELIVPYTTAYNYIDLNVKSEQTYTYHVVSHYSTLPDTAISTPNTVYVEKRDWAKVGYELTEIYNYSFKANATPTDSVHQCATTYANMASKSNYYYQGVYYDGYWYIAQYSDQATSATGGIIKISAAAPWENSTNNILDVGEKIISFSSGLNKGIACDYEGNLFVQSSSFGSRLKTGTVYINDGSGNFTKYTVDLSDIDLTEYNEHDKSKFLSTIPGRCDYYAMKGNLRTQGEAYLYLATSVSRAVFVVKLTYTGSAITASLHYSAQDTNTSRFTGQEFRQNNENYAFPINCNGRENEFIHQIRSNAYSAFACHDDDDRKAGRITTIYDTQSRVNCAGGYTFEFNGELFIISPQSQYSGNVGNFYIGMAERTDGQTPATANLAHIIPIAMYTQKDADISGASSSGTISFYVEIGDKDINGDGNRYNDYAYIYVYAPNGYRFAKYRLTPSSAFPPSQVTLTVAPQYARPDDDGTTHNAGGNIEQFNATASWPEVTDYGTTAGGNIFYSIKNYTLALVDAKGAAVEEYPSITFEVPRDVNEDGTIDNASTAITHNEDGTISNADGTTFANLTWMKNDKGVIIYSYVYEDVKKDFDYTAQVTVGYVGVDESNTGVAQKSPTTEWENTATYVPDAPSGTVLVDIDTDRWSDWDADYQGNPSTGAKDPADAYYDNYRVCLKLANPDFAENNYAKEPVTYYTIGIDEDKDGTIDQEVNNFKLFYGVASTVNTLADETETSPVVDKDGYISITDGQITGDYDFNIVTDGKPHVYWDMQDYTQSPGYDDGVTYTDESNPSTWNYIVTANYAATNAKISESASDTMAPDKGGITTGVEVISTQSVLNVYPIPATISVTIKCSEAVEGIEIYSESGMLVKKMTGNGEQVMTVNVSDLASGYYFMRVNNLSPVKIVKN